MMVNSSVPLPWLQETNKRNTSPPKKQQQQRQQQKQNTASNQKKPGTALCARNWKGSGLELAAGIYSDLNDIDSNNKAV